MQCCQEEEKTPSEAERERPAVPATCCSRRETHQSDTGIFALGGRGIAASRRRGAKGDRTPRFPIPSCDSPTFLWPLSAAFAAKKRGDAIKTALQSGAHCRRLGMASRVFPRITVRGSGCRLERVVKFFLGGSRRAGCPHPAAVNLCIPLQAAGWGHPALRRVSENRCRQNASMEWGQPRLLRQGRSNGGPVRALTRRKIFSPPS